MTIRSSADHHPLLVGIPACFRDMAGARFHIVADEYVLAVMGAVKAVPVIVPAVAEQQDLDALLSRLDGVLITGGSSNVEPARYDGQPSRAGTLHDPMRDVSNLAIIPAAIDAGIPLLAICRGLQEMNVAYGGTLHQNLHELPGRIDHRGPLNADLDVQYGPRHTVRLVEGGMMRRLLGTDTAMVNSLHWQGVDRLGEGLAVEAVAEDGTIEALRVETARAFALAVQWHPEYRFAENPVSRAIFGAFADAIEGRLRHLSAAAA